MEINTRQNITLCHTYNYGVGDGDIKRTHYPQLKVILAK